MAIRFGVVGTGHWARTVHIPGLLRAPDIDVVGVWGRIPSTARSVAASHGIAAFERFDDMLGTVDALSFAVPPDVQAELAPRAAAAGKHLLLEKPVARSVAAASPVAHAARTRGVSTLVFFMRRFVDEFEAALQLAAGNSWDEARVVMHYATLSADTPYRESRWRQDPGGALWDIGPHALSILLPVLGPVREIVVDPSVAPSSAPQCVDFTLRHDSGALSRTSLSLHAEPGHESLEFRFESASRSAALPVRPLDRVATFALAASELADNIANSRTAHRCDVDFGVEVTRILEHVEQARAASTTQHPEAND